MEKIKETLQIALKNVEEDLEKLRNEFNQRAGQKAMLQELLKKQDLWEKEKKVDEKK